MPDRFETGKFGEDAASEFLLSKNYRIITKNYRIGRIGEIDIIAEKRDGLWPFGKKTVVFVEVKAIVSSKNGKTQDSFAAYNPEMRVGPKKQKRLIRLCRTYLAKNRLSYDIPWQIDVIAVEVDAFSGEIAEIRHHENAIYE